MSEAIVPSVANHGDKVDCGTRQNLNRIGGTRNINVELRSRRDRPYPPVQAPALSETRSQGRPCHWKTLATEPRRRFAVCSAASDRIQKEKPNGSVSVCMTTPRTSTWKPFAPHPRRGAIGDRQSPNRFTGRAAASGTEQEEGQTEMGFRQTNTVPQLAHAATICRTAHPQPRRRCWVKAAALPLKCRMGDTNK